jgi:hypothetical protein
MHVNYFYDWTEPKQYSDDPEGNLVLLCASCAARAGDDVALAATGDEGAACELCGVSDDD